MSLPGSEISVILPNFNHGRYIRRAVESILAQDFLPSEVIIVDDGSTDDSLAMINELASGCPLIRVLRNSSNEGLVPAQLRALAAARGKYVHLAAADDTSLPGFYSIAIKMLSQYPEAGLFVGDSALFDGITKRFLSIRPIVMPRFTAGYVSPSHARQMLARSDNWILTGAAVIRVEALNACGGLDKELGSFADGFLTRKIALTRGYCYAPKPVATWTIFPTSASRSVALDPAKSSALREVAVARIAADPIFPSWYPTIFANRWRFATARLALHQGRINSATVVALGAKNQIDKVALNLILATSKGFLGRIAAAAWLQIRLRPYRLINIIVTFLYRIFFCDRHRGEFR